MVPVGRGWRALLLAVVACCLVGSMDAQVTATLWGRVTDPSGAAVSDAAVTATNQETGVSRSTITDKAGRYQLTAVPVGQYEVHVRKQGFAEEVRAGIHLVIGQDAAVNLS